MPDLQSELSKVIDQWSEPEMPETPNTPTPKVHRFAVTKGTSRAVSDYLLANPGVQYKKLWQDMVAAGHNRPTVQTMIHQMTMQKLIARGPDDSLTATYTEYTPIKAYAAWKRAQAQSDTAAKRAAAAQKRKATAAATRAAKAAAYEAHENYNPTAAPRVVAAPEFDAEDFVNGLTLKQAKAVYSELKKVFE